MKSTENDRQNKVSMKKLTRFKPYLILFCLAVLAFSYMQLSKTNALATEEQIAELKAAAKLDKRPEIPEKLNKELNINPNPKVWQLNNMKEKLGLTYIDLESAKEEAK